ncbi:MAG TPA: YceI family protein [Verrucomicrobiae bacterium]
MTTKITALSFLSFLTAAWKLARSEPRAHILSFLALLTGASAWTAPLEFDFKDPKGVNNAAFKMDAPLEKISGTGTGISGKAVFDPENASSLKGKIVLAVSSLHVPNPKMKQHLHGPEWMNAAQHPEITFEVVSTRNVKTETNATTAEVLGKLTVKGTTKEVTVPLKMTYLKDRLKMRAGREGDLLVLQGTFNIKRSDYGINTGKMENKVADVIQLTLSLVGSAPRP